MRIAWIGLGSMGRPMALAALRAGHDVHGYARRPAEQGAIRDAGGRVGDDLPAAVADARIVCVNLFSEVQLRDVVVAGGVVEAMQAGAILAIHSTVSPGFVRALGAMRGDIDVLDAGFSGGPEEALAGQLALMVGGEAAALERARPVFAAYAGHVAHVGPLGSGMALKVINNLMFAAHVAIARDALRLMQAQGLAPDVAVATLMRGSAGSNALGLLGRSGDAEAMVAAIRPYLDKDVPIARAGAQGLDLATLGTATSGFG
jgi:3-hydroxyisobutyrate dehydrogenase